MTDLARERWMTRGFAGVLAVLAALAPSTATTAAQDAIVERTATAPFEQTATGIREGLEANKMAIIRQIHFHDMLSVVGIEAEQMLTFETFHPRYGKVVYANDRDAFIELPLRIHVREMDGKVIVRYRPPSAVFAGYTGLSDLGAELDQMFAEIVGGVAR